MTLSVVVLPEPVPPLMRMFSRPRTQASSTSAAGRVRVPMVTRSLTVNGSLENLRMVSEQPSRAIGGSTALTRLPSGRRASTMGLASSTRRPTRDTMRSIVRRRCSSSENRRSVWKSRPPRSMKIESARLTMISVISGSRSSGSSGPLPRMSSMISWVILARSPVDSGFFDFARTVWIALKTFSSRRRCSIWPAYACWPSDCMRLSWTSCLSAANSSCCRPTPGVA